MGHRRSSTGTPRPTPGFALVITMSLVILLMVVGVGLLSLASISIRQSSATNQMAIARDNARLALLLAIGELQRHAGPDQRVTATADIAGEADGSTLAPGKPPLNNTTVTRANKGLSAVQPGTRYWTGVWTNSGTTPSLILTRTPSPTLLQWLVSGNAGLPVANGHTPASPVAAINSDGTVADPTKAALLVGPNTVGPASTETIQRYVAAPLVPVQASAIDSAPPAGRYAWWVGDEGVKATIDINVDPNRTDPTSYASLVAQRRGWETVNGLQEYPAPNSGRDASIPKLVTLPEGTLLMPTAGKPAAPSSPIQSVFHSATADSQAVVTDVLNGGTRVDLTNILSQPLPTTNPVPAITNYPVKNTNIVSRTASRTMRAPKWDSLKDFHDRSANLSSGALLVKAAANELSQSIAPTIIDFRILMGVRFVKVDAKYKANPVGKIAIAIANPYSVPLKWSQPLDIEVMNQTPMGNRPSRLWNLNNNSVYIGSPSSDAARHIATEASVFGDGMIFRIRPDTLPPGQARAYTLGAQVMRDRSRAARTVDLVPVASSAAWNLNNSVELDTTGTWDGVWGGSGFPSLDIRESWQTTLIMVEMRHGSGQLLRRVERFELDNGYFTPNTRNGSNTPPPSQLNAPIGLMLYSFQISQPGVDYKSYMPGPYEMGQRCSTIRTFADFNLQATRFGKPITSYNPPPFFCESNDSISQLPSNPAGETGLGFTRNLALDPLPWGRSSSGSTKTVLFSVPSDIVSLAQFQHADLTGDDVAASISHQPAYAVGNSYATPFVKRSLVYQDRTDYEIIGTPNHSGAKFGQYPLPESPRRYYDISYLLNASLWDTYFLSTVRANSADPNRLEPLNPTLILHGTDANLSLLKDPVKCAGRLMIDGAFNINCTDKQAWKAFLASTKHFKHKADSGPVANAAFPRTLEQPSPAADKPTGAAADSFAGFRRLTDAEIDALATEIVKQVRLRGPFVCLSHFVNRAIANITEQPALTRAGALQLAIDESGATIDFNGSKNAFSGVNPTQDRVTLAWKSNAPRADFDGGDTANQLPNAGSEQDWAVTSIDNNFGAVASIIADREMLREDRYKREQGYRSTSIPGWLTQADVLQAIGPAITARSDTFRIRAYGEALDAGGKVVAKAWCEGIVQRVPEYVDTANDPSARGADLTAMNKVYGRQFRLTSFRWLTAAEV